MQIPTTKSGPSLPYPWPSGLFPREECDASERRKPPELPEAGLPVSKGIQVVCHNAWSIYRDLSVASFHVAARRAALSAAGDNQLRQDLIEEADLLVRPVQKAWEHLNYAFFGGAVHGEYKIEAHYPNSRNKARPFDAEDWRAELGCEFWLTKDYSTIQLCTMDVPAQVIETFHRIKILPRKPKAYLNKIDKIEFRYFNEWRIKNYEYKTMDVGIRKTSLSKYLKKKMTKGPGKDAAGKLLERIAIAETEDSMNWENFDSNNEMYDAISEKVHVLGWRFGFKREGSNRKMSRLQVAYHFKGAHGQS